MTNETEGGAGEVTRPERATAEGFIINGRNETSLIRGLKALDGTPIETLKTRMRTGPAFPSPYIGANESLTDVLAEDNETVLGMGRTHQELANFLFQFDVKDRSDRRPTIVERNGIQFMRTVQGFSSREDSPFDDGTYTNLDYTVTNLQTGAMITYSGLLPEMIHRYGFYEGHESSYRLDPRDISEVAGFIPPPADDPVVQLVQDRDADVQITNLEQFKRMLRLDSGNVDVFRGNNYRIVAQDVGMIIDIGHTFGALGIKPVSTQEQRDLIAGKIDTQNIEPRPYRIDRDNITDFTEVIPNRFPSLKETVVQGIDELKLPTAAWNESAGDAEKFLRAAVQGIEGQSDAPEPPHKAYYEALLNKLARDDDSIITFFKAATRMSPEMIAQLDTHLPTLRTDILALYNQLGMATGANATLEQLVRFKQIMDNYTLFVRQATQAVRVRGQIQDASVSDIKALLKIVSVAQSNPSHDFTEEERGVMERLHTRPDLIPYAVQPDQPGTPISLGYAVSRLYSGDAEQRQREEEP